MSMPPQVGRVPMRDERGGWEMAAKGREHCYCLCCRDF
jgi:hypothetical protein